MLDQQLQADSVRPMCRCWKVRVAAVDQQPLLKAVFGRQYPIWLVHINGFAKFRPPRKRSDVNALQQPFDPLQCCCFRLDDGRVRPGTLDHLPQHRQPHGNMEPIQNMFDLRRDILLQTPQSSRTWPQSRSGCNFCPRRLRGLVADVQAHQPTQRCACISRRAPHPASLTPLRPSRPRHT